MDMLPSLCMSCRRLKDDETCSAFPGGIPEDIFMFGADHRVPIKGDHGLQYLPKDGMDEEREIWERYHKEMVKSGVIKAAAEPEPVKAQRRKSTRHR